MWHEDFPVLIDTEAMLLFQIDLKLVPPGSQPWKFYQNTLEFDDSPMKPSFPWISQLNMFDDLRVSYCKLLVA